TLWSWGFNNYGQLGNGNTTGSSVPLQVGSDNGWLMACGFYQSIGIKTNGQILTWGSNSYGQLGNGSLINSFSPGQITNRGDKPYQISSGHLNNLIIKSNGSLWGWGSNSSGELGDGTQVDKLIPSQVGTETNWRNVKTYSAMSVGIKQDGTLWAWGNNQNQALGSGSSTPMYQTTPLLISNDGKWMDIASSQNGFCSMMIKADGTLWGWGLNQYGELGNGTTTQLFTPTQIGTDTWKAVSIGNTHSLGIKSNGTLWAWGMGGAGELGTGIDYAQSLEPTQVGTSAGWVAIQAGQGYSIALTVNGILWTWGNGWYGTLGNGSHTNVNIPTFISLDGYWKNINTAGSFVTALKSNGQLWGWGANNSFQLTNPPGPTNIPIQLSPDEDWINTGAGSSFTTALHSNGIICAVGSN
ncbi:MAG TPA: hypothetical protein PKU77_01920, partial [Ferruginibacter sp.]|nr:hypothetical protein [Ferruginibacter sp.]